MYASAKAGMILVNVNPAYKSHELEYRLNKVEIKALISVEGSKQHHHYQLLHELCPEMQGSGINGKRFKKYVLTLCTWYNKR